MDDLPELKPQGNVAVYGESIDLEGEDPPKEPPKTPKQQQKLLSCMKCLATFQDHSDDLLQELVDYFAYRKYRKGDVVFEQKSIGNHFYIVDHGTFEVVVKDEDGKSRVAHTYHGSGHFGEISLYYADERLASVRAASDGALWELSRVTYRTYASRAAYRRCTFLEDSILKIPEFKTLNPDDLVRVADALHPQELSANHVVYEQGSKPCGLYIVEKGELEMTMQEENGDDIIYVRTLYPGDQFGYFELFRNIPRISTVTTKTRATLAFINEDILSDLLGPLDEFHRKAGAEHSILG